MRIRIHGTRGSYPTSSKDYEYYGGATSCIEVIYEQERIILDAGTGIINLNEDDYYRKRRINILLTHLHMDHIQGLAFFQPLFNSENEVYIWGPKGGNTGLRLRLNRYLSPPLFPLPLRDVPCNLTIKEFPDDPFKIGSFQISADYVSHPGPTVGFRVECEGKKFAYIPDHEPMIGKLELYQEQKWISGIELAQGADLLIHDAQYGNEEYLKKAGWGHSTLQHAAQFSERAKVDKLLLFHHDPAHNDQMIKEMFSEFISDKNFPFDVDMAIQGQEVLI